MRITFDENKIIRGSVGTGPDVTVQNSVTYTADQTTGEDVRFFEVVATKYKKAENWTTIRLTSGDEFELTNDGYSLDDGYVIVDYVDALDVGSAVGNTITNSSFKPIVKSGAWSKLLTHDTPIGTTAYRYKNARIDADSVLGSAMRKILRMVQGLSYSEGKTYRYSSSNYTHGSESATPNADLFCKDIDFSCVAFSRVIDGSPRPAFPPVLIHPEFVVHAAHVTPSVGSKVVFRRQDGTFQTVTILGHYGHLMPSGKDFGLSRLSAPITGINPATVLADDYQDFIPALMGRINYKDNVTTGAPYFFGLPLIGLYAKLPTEQHHFRLVEGIKDNSSGNIETSKYRFGSVRGGSDGQTEVFQFLDDTQYSSLDDYFRVVYSGDSSSPLFLTLSDSPILLATQWTGGIGGQTGGIFLPSNLNPAINSVMGTSNVNYLNIFNFEGYRRYD